MNRLLGVSIALWAAASVHAQEIAPNPNLRAEGIPPIPAALALTISTLVIVVFSLFLLYDLNRIIRGGETNYVMATTGVYLSLFNIFANLLSLLMSLAGERD